MTGGPLINCPICNRLIPYFVQEKHHLIPKAKGGKIVELICMDCHDTIHAFFTNPELKYQYQTIEAILQNEKIQKWIKWIKWISKKPVTFGVCQKRKK